MSKIEDGGPAFPMLGKIVDGEWESYSQFTGMTLRDYFTAHAPAEPQPWFVPTMPPAPDLTVWIGESGRKYDGENSATRSEEGLRGKVRPVNMMAHCAWLNEQAKQRYVQWPAAWADAMLAARGEEK